MSGHSVILGHSYTGEIYSLVLDTNHCGVGRGIRMWRRGGGGPKENFAFWGHSSVPNFTPIILNIHKWGEFWFYHSQQMNDSAVSHQSVEVHITNSTGHTKAWESISPTQRVTSKFGSLYPQLKGPHQTVEVRIPTSRGNTKVRVRKK